MWFDSLLRATNRLTDHFIALWQLTTKGQEMVNILSSWVPTTRFRTSTTRNLSVSISTESSIGLDVEHTLQSRLPNSWVCICCINVFFWSLHHWEILLSFCSWELVYAWFFFCRHLHLLDNIYLAFYYFFFTRFCNL